MMKITRILTILLLLMITSVPGIKATEPFTYEPTNATTGFRIARLGEELVQESTEIAGLVTPKHQALEALTPDLKESQSIVPDLLTYARKHLGKRYRRGSAGPHAFDCSGFTSHVFKQFGYSLPRSSREQYTRGESLQRDELQPGDLVFFSGRAAGKHVGHVGMVTEVNPANGSFKFIHATNGAGVKIDNFPDGGYFSRRYIGAKRILSADDQGL